MKKIAILASGSGTNAENIYKFFANGNRVSVPIVIYDRASAGVAERMEKYPDVKTIYVAPNIWKESPEEIVKLLSREGIDLVALAGFLRFVPKELTQAFEGRMLNIHPSLIPAYCGPGMYGEKVHQAVIAAGEKKSGVTVHYVTDVVDGGEILMQEEVEVDADDTPASLAQKIHKVEYSLYPRAIVAALSRMESAPATAENPPVIPGVTPPPAPSPAEEWAEVLGVNYDPERMAHIDSETETPAETPKANANIPQPSFKGAQNQQPSPASDNSDKMPSTYLVWAVIMTVICCLPAGIVAIIFSCQVSSKFYAGDFNGALKASERAQIWIIVSFVLGVMSNTLYLPLMMLF